MELYASVVNATRGSIARFFLRVSYITEFIIRMELWAGLVVE